MLDRLVGPMLVDVHARPGLGIGFGFGGGFGVESGWLSGLQSGLGQMVRVRLVWVWVQVRFIASIPSQLARWCALRDPQQPLPQVLLVEAAEARSLGDEVRLRPGDDSVHGAGQAARALHWAADRVGRARVRAESGVRPVDKRAE